MAVTGEVGVGERRICEQPNARERKLSDAESSGIRAGGIDVDPQGWSSKRG